MARDGLKRLKDVFARFVENHPNYYLVYDSTHSTSWLPDSLEHADNTAIANWGGLVSNAYFQTGDPGRDFGNSHYNDHHFHYVSSSALLSIFS